MLTWSSSGAARIGAMSKSPDRRLVKPAELAGPRADARRAPTSSLLGGGPGSTLANPLFLLGSAFLAAMLAIALVGIVSAL